LSGRCLDAFRLLVVAARTPADAVTRGEAPPGERGGSYGRADEVAEGALTRTGPDR
jgi:hypothetical protein